LSAKPGRPLAINEKRGLELRDALSHNKYQVEEEIYKNILHEKTILTANDRNKGASSVVPISRQTIKRVEEKYGLNEGDAETTTTARAEACADIRNLASFAAMNHFMVPNVDPRLIINSDASSFSVGLL
jgi:hypothetical protein